MVRLDEHLLDKWMNGQMGKFYTRSDLFNLTNSFGSHFQKNEFKKESFLLFIIAKIWK